MKIQLVGDVHGEFEHLEPIIKHFDGMTIQLGDLGIGFPHNGGITNFVYDRNKFRFIRGNHDNPEYCKKHQNHLGDYGMINDIFYISGAFSVDQNIRTEGVNWWRGEELSMVEAYRALNLYESLKPSIVISHDCPRNVSEMLWGSYIKNKTADLFYAMLKTHKPDMWIFAHHHKSITYDIGGTVFKCLDCFEKYELKPE